MALTESELNDLQSLMQDERFDDAIVAARGMLRRNADVPLLYNVMGVAMMQTGRPDDATRAFQRAHAMAPDYTEVTHNLVAALIGTGRVAEAEAPIRAALRDRPGDPSLLRNLASALVLKADWPAAQEAAKQAMIAEPGHPAARVMLASIQREQGQLTEALETLAPLADVAEAQLVRGEILAAQGEPGAARAAFEAALALDPAEVAAWEGIAAVTTFAPDDPRLDRLRAALDAASGEARTRLSFVLARALADSGADAQVFALLDTAQAVRRQQAPAYSHAQRRKEIGRIRTLFGPEQVAALSAQGRTDVQPVFLIGMPGTAAETVARALAAHPQIHATDAPGAIPGLGRAVLAAPRVMTPDWVAARAGALASGASDAPRLFDPTPANADWAGLILTLFPKARIVHVTRDPRATALDLYAQDMPAEPFPWAHDLEDIASYHAQLDALIEHWQAQFPDAFVTCRYEGLRADPDPQLRALAEALGLAPHPAMMEALDAPGAFEDWTRHEDALAPFIRAMARQDRPL
ncbi:hypothetical protein C4N9_14930 [Pararhodobacter marinus]|uniref:Ancillary SecYEG translocon subunit/Cell division coordinator CpoB TPR domain-containing protein n=1 Tax=Pararhodobacter marinus TaxID=2184063 RepID=A0A2U2C758_9RHOB|nr:tetratricopeptide repeat-containing sulfotransferase family protein [Pararhodobacter marinus]PWE27728.1 hypothetical protein C4N9_14930 [Pararhodobacter marinus]